MRHVSISTAIDAELEDVWLLLAEFRHWPSWGVSVRSVDAPVDTVAVGVEGRVRTVVGISLPFLITGVVPNRSWDWRVAGVRATGHRLEPQGDGMVRATFTVPWPAFPYLVVLWLSLRRLRKIAEAG